MIRFNYRLQPLLNVKRQMEDMAKNDLAKKIIKLQEEQEKFNDVVNRKENCLDRIEEESARGVSVGRLRQYNDYLYCINQKLQFQQKNVDIASQEVEICRDKLIECVKEKKILETLKDKKMQQYMEDMMRAEEKIVEEIVYSKFIASKEEVSS
ncbi:MAG: flagellar export protein FliJ [Clostridiaceae bacterium]|nr:flagellar export protein FliJ [Clostridiaceae bacterium]